MIIRILLSVFLVLLLSCSKDKPETSVDTTDTGAQKTARKSPEQAPSDVAEKTEGPMSIDISPERVFASSTLTLRANGFEPPAPGGEDRMVWLLNGAPVSSADPARLVLSEHLATAGDTVQAVAVIGGREIYSNHVTLLNNPPVITGYQFYDTQDESGNIAIDVKVDDPDGDTVTLEYQWTVNGLPGGASEMLDFPPSQNDKIAVTVRAFDGTDYSEEISYDFQILGSAPRFQRVMEYYMEGATYIYNALATDPDREPITFSLVNAPAGMAVDPESGQVRWDVPSDFSGDLHYIIVATDPKGQNGILPMNFSVFRE